MIIIDKDRHCLVRQNDDACYVIYPDITNTNTINYEFERTRLLMTTYDMYELSLEEFRLTLNNYKRNNKIEVDLSQKSPIEHFGKWNKDDISEKYNFSFLDYYIFERKSLCQLFN